MDDGGAGVSGETARQQSEQPPPTPPPHAPTISSPGIVALDITERFSKAVKEALAPGELVKDGFFTLFEAVSALEIMDPKMDSGCIKPGEEFDELYDVSRRLSPQEVLGIIDELICHEMSWHLGYPLSQTLLTSVYIEALTDPNPQSEKEAQFVKEEYHATHYEPMLRVLRAYCMAVIKTCDYVIESIKSEHYYEEEDFVTNTYSRHLLNKVPTGDVCNALQQAMRLLLDQRYDIGLLVADGLISRLELRQALLDAVQCYDHIKDPSTARKPWTQALSILPRIYLSHNLGKPLDAAFTEKLQRKLDSTLSPRPIVKLDFTAAFGHLKRLIEDGSCVMSVIDNPKSQNVQTFVSTFQAKKPQPLVYIRTLLQIFLFTAMDVVDSMKVRNLLDDDLRTILLPSNILLDADNDDVEVVHDVRHFLAQHVATFRNKAVQTFLDVLRTACQNRCRVRRTLCHLIRDWDSLEREAAAIDTVLVSKTKAQMLLAAASTKSMPIDLHGASLSSWCRLYKLRQMELIVQLGFELEIVQPDEMAGMYWFLSYLTKIRAKCVRGIRDTVMRQVKVVSPSSPDEPQHVKQAINHAIYHTQLAILDVSYAVLLTDALSHLYIALRRLGTLPGPAQPYDNDELRYALRMKPFAEIESPPMPSFDEFRADTLLSQVSLDKLLSNGEYLALEARKILESKVKLSAEQSFSVNCHDLWLASVKRVLKASIAICLAFSSVQKAIKSAKDGKVQIKAEVPPVAQDYHEWWRVPIITVLE